MLDVLPEELWIDIILELSCKTIKVVCEIEQFKLLCEKNNLFERRKVFGFPRKTKHCGWYNIWSLVSFGFEEFDDLLTTNPEPLDEITNNLIYKLDLVRGDLLYFDDIEEIGMNIDYNSMYIFDGCSILKLDKINEEVSALPSEFITNISLEYWRNTSWDVGLKYLNLNLTKFRDQLITNIQFTGKLEIDNVTVFSKFVINNLEYGIIYINIYMHSKPSITHNFNKFIEILSSDILTLKYIRPNLVKSEYNGYIPHNSFYLYEQ